MKKVIFSIIIIFILSINCYANVNNQFYGINEPSNWKPLHEKYMFNVVCKTSNMLAYIKVSSFAKQSCDIFEEILIKLNDEDIQKIILDLRYNQGGIMEEAIRISELLIPKGKICTVYLDEQGAIEYYSSKENLDFKIVVLVNAFTASSAELLASAIQESGAGVIVGSRTYGKNSIQQISVSANNQVTIETVGKYLTRNGNDIEMIGLTPDYEVINEYKTSHDFNLESFGVDDILAAQQRLFLLGYNAEMHGELAEEFQSVIFEFQKDNGLEQTGVLDSETLNKIKLLENSIVVVCDNQLLKAIELLTD